MAAVSTHLSEISVPVVAKAMPARVQLLSFLAIKVVRKIAADIVVNDQSNKFQWHFFDRHLHGLGDHRETTAIVEPAESLRAAKRRLDMALLPAIQESISGPCAVSPSGMHQLFAVVIPVVR